MASADSQPPSPAGGTPPRATDRSFAYLVLVGIASCITYAAALDNPFIYDDRHIVVWNDFIKDPKLYGEFFRGGINSERTLGGHTRPLPMLSLALNYQIGGLDPWGYRLTNLAIHVGCVFLGWVVLRRLLAAFPLRRGPPLSRREAAIAALAAAAFFAVHPLNSQIVLTVWKRTTALSALFSLAALWAFCALRGIGGGPPGRRGARVALSLATCFFLLLAVASKETAVAVPVLLLALEIWPRADAPAWDRRRLLGAGLLQAGQWLVVLPWLTFLFPRYASQISDFTPWPFLLTQAKVIWFYVAMVFNPGLLAASYDVELARSLADPGAVAGGLGIIGALTFAIAAARRTPLVGLAILWTLLALAPTSSIVPGPMLVDEDRCYLAFLPMWGLAGGGLVLLSRVGHRARLAGMALGATAVLGSMTATVLRGAIWSDPLGVWVDAVKKYPDSFMAHRNICAELAKRPDDLPVALAECRRAAAGPPPDPGSTISLSKLLIKAGRYTEASQAAALASRMLPNAGHPLRLAGHAEWASGAPGRAVPHYERAILLDPRDDEARLYLAKCFQELGRAADARRMLESLSAASPLFADAVASSLAAEIRRELAQSAAARPEE